MVSNAFETADGDNDCCDDPIPLWGDIEDGEGVLFAHYTCDNCGAEFRDVFEFARTEVRR